MSSLDEYDSDQFDRFMELMHDDSNLEKRVLRTELSYRDLEDQEKEIYWRNLIEHSSNFNPFVFSNNEDDEVFEYNESFYDNLFNFLNEYYTIDHPYFANSVKEEHYYGQFVDNCELGYLKDQDSFFEKVEESNLNHLPYFLFSLSQGNFHASIKNIYDDKPYNYKNTNLHKKVKSDIKRLLKDIAFFHYLYPKSIKKRFTFFSSPNTDYLIKFISNEDIIKEKQSEDYNSSNVNLFNLISTIGKRAYECYLKKTNTMIPLEGTLRPFKFLSSIYSNNIHASKIIKFPEHYDLNYVVELIKLNVNPKELNLIPTFFESEDAVKLLKAGFNPHQIKKLFETFTSSEYYQSLYELNMPDYSSDHNLGLDDWEYNFHYNKYMSPSEIATYELGAYHPSDDYDDFLGFPTLNKICYTFANLKYTTNTKKIVVLNSNDLTRIILKLYPDANSLPRYPKNVLGDFFANWNNLDDKIASQMLPSYGFEIRKAIELGATPNKLEKYHRQLHVAERAILNKIGLNEENGFDISSDDFSAIAKIVLSFNYIKKAKDINVIGTGGGGIVFRTKKHVWKYSNKFKRELDNLKKLKNPQNVIKLIGVAKNKPFLKLDYVVGETLDKYIKERRRRPFLSYKSPATFSSVSEWYSGPTYLLRIVRQEYYEDIIRRSKEIVKGLIELRSAGIIHHMDLKPTNIMFDWMSSKAIIIDLGEASTKRWPNEKPKNNRLYGTNDIVSLGQIIYRMATDEKLFTDENENVDFSVTNTNVKNLVSKERKQIYKKGKFALRPYFRKIDQTIHCEEIKNMIKYCLLAKPYHLKKTQKYFVEQGQKFKQRITNDTRF